MLPSLGIKALSVVAAVAIAAFAVYGYNQAIKKAEALRKENIQLRSGMQEAAAQLAKAHKQAERTAALLKQQQDQTEVIRETEIKTVEVIKEVQGECLDAPVPAVIVERLRNP